jgi:hypothetical protein
MTRAERIGGRQSCPLDERVARGVAIEDPRPSEAGGGHAADGRLQARNVSDCASTSDDSQLLCPFVRRDSVRQDGQGYVLSQLADPGGPFDGFWYVANMTISIKRLALINPWLQPGGPPLPRARTRWYDHNVRARRDVAGYRRALSLHEGEGHPGNPRAGHTGAMRAKIATTPTLDPRRAAEPRFAASMAWAVARVDTALDQAEADIDNASNDPLPDDLPGHRGVGEPRHHSSSVGAGRHRGSWCLTRHTREGEARRSVCGRERAGDHSTGA